MPIQKQPVNINFSQGLDTKTDPFQVPIGKFAQLTNSVFTKGGLLQKSNGFGQLTSLPNSASTFVTTFNGDLTALGTTLQAYSPGSKTWVNQGSIQPCQLSTLPLLRNNLNQSQSDTALSPNGFICTVYTENNAGTNTFKYVVADSTTGQNVVAPTAISQADATYGTPKVFLLGNYFVIVFTNKVSTVYHLKFFAISTAQPTIVTTPADVSTSYTPSATVNFDGVVMNSNLYLAWNGSSTSGIKTAYISSGLSISASTNPDSAHVATLMSVTADVTTNAVWVSYYDSGSSTGYSFAMNGNLQKFASFPVETIASGTILNLASAAQNGVMTLFYEVSGAVVKVNTLTQSATLGTAATLKRSVGIASKGFIVDGVIYLLVAFSSTYQPTYFLLNAAGLIVAKLAYQNGGGYYVTGVPSVSVTGNIASVSYLYKDLVQAVNKGTALPAGTQSAGIYSQTGVNLVNFTLGTSGISTAEIGLNLNVTGGFLGAYDGYAFVENGFFIWPEGVTATWSASGGSIVAEPNGSTNTNAYYYQVTYEWSDNQGNLFRSAPSIPLAVTTSGSGSSGSISLVIPTLRLTYKTANPVKLVVYRWSIGQQSYYQTTSITSPVLNDLTVDSITFLDTNSDATILGNNLLYTTGGVVENINGPACSALTLFDNRLWLIDSEDPNLLWYGKEVIEATPVEMSDLLTYYVAPTIGSQGSTGPMKCIAAMDDKLIIFKSNAIYYVNGAGPDSTGANSQYSQPVFITSAAGCSNPQSVTLTPEGLMFQSDKGIWKLGRDLGTTYVGAPVENYNGLTIQGAQGIPGTNQERFTSPSGTTQMFDYYYNQWGTFNNMPAVSSTLYQNKHTYISSIGQVFQETPNQYLIGSSPVLMNFQTGWINLAGLQGYQRAYYFYLLGTYLSPHKLFIQVAYDYNPNPTQTLTINPTNFSPVYGADPLYGDGSPYGGAQTLEQWRIFFQRQKCESFQLTVNELYDPSLGVVAGPGLTLSGINMVIGVKKGWKPISGANSTG